MNNLWIRNRAVAWMLIVTFTLTSVFTPGVAFAAEPESATPVVTIDANKGNALITYKEKDEEGQIVTDEFDAEWEKYRTEIGEAGSLDDFIDSLEITYWYEERQLEGWEVYRCTYSEEEGRMPELIEVIEPDSLLSYSFPEEPVLFIAKWEGDDSAYMSNVAFRTPKGSFAVDYGDGQPYLESYIEVSLRETELAELNIGDQYSQQHGITVTGTATYSESEEAEPETSTGWYKFVRDEETGIYAAEDDLETQYMTEDIWKANVPADSIAFVAVWEGMELETYLQYLNGDTGNGDDEDYYGPQIEIDFNGGTGFIDGEDYGEYWEGRLLNEEKTLREFFDSLSVTYWTDTRTLEGWNVYQWEPYDNCECDREEHPYCGSFANEPVTTIEPDEIMDYSFKDGMVRFRAQWTGNDADFYSDVIFKTGKDGWKCFVAYDNWTEGYYWFKETGKAGEEKTIGKQLEDYYGEECTIVLKEVDEEDNVLTEVENLGFHMFTKNDEGVFVYDGEELGDPLGIDAILAMDVPENDIAFVVAWEDVSLEDYLALVNDSVSAAPAVSIDPNRGKATITCKSQEEGEAVTESVEGTDWWSRELGDATKLGDLITGVEMEYWADRDFAGWLVKRNVWFEPEMEDEEGWWDWQYVDENDLLDTAEILDYPFEGEDILFEAQWTGDDSAYFSDVYFRTIKGDIQITTRGEQWNTDCFGDKLSQSDVTIGEQLEQWYGERYDISAMAEDDEGNNVTSDTWYKFVLNEGEGYVAADDPLKTYSLEEALALEVPEEDVVFAAVWGDVTLEDYLLWLNGDGDDGGFDIPENVVQLDCHYYNTDGEFEYYPIAIELKEDNTKTFDDLIQEAVKNLNHYPNLGTVTWSYGGSVDYDDVAYGGELINVHPTYEKALIHTSIQYINEKGEVDYVDSNMVLEKNETYETVKACMLEDAAKLKHGREFAGDWTFSEEDNLQNAVMPELEEGEEYNYDHYVTLSANYASYDVDVKLFYLDGSGNVKMIDKTVEVAAGTAVKDIYDEQLNLELDTEDATHEWANHNWYDIGSGVIDLTVDRLCAAVQYENATPVFVTRYLVEGESDAYYASIKEDEVYYLEGIPEIRETEDGFVVDEDFTANVLEAVKEAHREEAEGFTFYRYVLSYDLPDVCLQDGFAPGLFYSLEAVYDKALVAFTWYDDEGKKTKNVAIGVDEDGWAECILPQDGNMVQFWDIGGPTSGGRYEMSGSTIDVFTPYTTVVSRYRLNINGLTEVPEGFTLEEVKTKLKAEANDDNAFAAHKLTLNYYDVKLLLGEEGKVIAGDDFPAEGIEFFIPCPSNMDPTSEKIRVTHLITEKGEAYGTTEKLDFEIIEREDGSTLKVKAYSLSPIAVAYEDINAHEHSYTWKVTTAPGCETAGVKTGTCSCNDVKTEVIPATGHTKVILPAKAPTCTATGLTAGEKCSACQKVLLAQQPVAALDHKAGTPKVTVKATASKAGTKVSSCTVCGIALTQTTIKPAKVTLSKTAYTYNGKVISSKNLPKVSVKTGDGKTIAAKYYTVSKPKNEKKMKDIGRYTYTVKFKSTCPEYKGTIKLHMEIKPVKVTQKAPKAAKKAVTVKWKSGKQAQVTGYEVIAATDKKLTKNTKKAAVTGYKKTSKQIKGLKAKKTYYVSVRAYKTVKGVKIYSDWSVPKKIKTK